MRSYLPILTAALTSSLAAHEGHHHQADEMTQAATTFLSALDEKQSKQARIPFADDEREGWHFVPLDNRKGVRLGDLGPGQLPIAYAFLGTGLTDEGFRTAGSIMSLEQYLAVKEKQPQGA